MYKMERISFLFLLCKSLKIKEKSLDSDEASKSPVFRGRKYQNVKPYILSFLLRNKKLFLRFFFFDKESRRKRMKY